MFTFSQACLWFSTSCPIGSVSQPLKKKRKNIDLNSCQTKKQQRMMTMPTEWVNHLYKQPNTISKNHSWKKKPFWEAKTPYFFIHRMFSLGIRKVRLFYMFFRVYADILLCFIQRSKLNERHIAYPREWKISARVHTNAFSIENTYISMRWAGPPNTKTLIVFIESASIWIRSQKWIKT